MRERSTFTAILTALLPLFIIVPMVVFMVWMMQEPESARRERIALEERDASLKIVRVCSDDLFVYSTPDKQLYVGPSSKGTLLQAVYGQDPSILCQGIQ